METPRATFMLSALGRSQFPSHDLPELAFAGRSNVGKSSLINSLFGRKQVARVSSTPGRTQAINFFNVNQEWIFADLPGYGFAKVPMAIRASWQSLIEAYLVDRTPLQGVVLIVDIRRDPMDSDLQLRDFLAANHIPLLLVATKADKLSKQKVQQQHSILARAYAVERDAIVPYSSLTGMGKDVLWKEIWALMTEGAERMKAVRLEFEARNRARKLGGLEPESDTERVEPDLPVVITREDGSW